jgi:hypothetical protein
VSDPFKTGVSRAPRDIVASDSRHLSIHIDRPFQMVYDYASNPSHLREWAPGLGSSVDGVDGPWCSHFCDSRGE